MKIAIIGSRSLTDVDLGAYIEETPEAVISGGARGVDTLARQYAQERNIPLVEILPEYDRYGRRAPLVRDREIARQCDKLYAFWDGVSRGTIYTVRYAREIGREVVLTVCPSGQPR